MKKLLLMTAFCVLFFKVIKKVLVKVVSVLVFVQVCCLSLWMI